MFDRITVDPCRHLLLLRPLISKFFYRQSFFVTRVHRRQSFVISRYYCRDLLHRDFTEDRACSHIRYLRQSASLVSIFKNSKLFSLFMYKSFFLGKRVIIYCCSTFFSPFVPRYLFFLFIVFFVCMRMCVYVFVWYIINVVLHLVKRKS